LAPFELSREVVLGVAMLGFSGTLIYFFAHRLRLLADQALQSEDRSRQSEERLRCLFEESPIGQMLIEPDRLNIVQCNQAAAQVLGYSRQNLCRLSVRDFTVGVDGEADQTLQQRLFSHENVQAELQVRRKDGARRDVSMTVVPLKTPEGLRFHATQVDITELKLAQEELRIAATAFDCNEAIIVMDAEFKILRVNNAVTQMSGYSDYEIQGRHISELRPGRHLPAFYEAIWHEVARHGVWRGELWQTLKSGEDRPFLGTLTAVKNKRGVVTHYVSSMVDATNNRLMEKQRLLNEAAHRNTLVREVHHRIKNHLQGIVGILNRFAKKHPDTAVPLHQAIGQVQSISIIHGLQGHSATSSVLLCELIRAISDEIQVLWQTPMVLDIASDWPRYFVTEDEAVPIALVLNELILNAVKHGGQSHGSVSVGLCQGSDVGVVHIRIGNQGHFEFNRHPSRMPHSGLNLIEALMPRHGARILRDQQRDQVVTWLELEPPVIYLQSVPPATQGATVLAEPERWRSAIVGVETGR
jgi:PAS domain S-box-containing protein